MNGKILKISNNDLYGNVDDRMVAVFAAFNHKKYMNKYVIFSYDGELAKKKLYFGSLHLKDNSIVVFSVNEATKQYIATFVNSYLTDSVNPNEYELIDISNMEKIEIVSCNECNFDALETLDQKSIKRVVVNEEESPKAKRVFLYFLLFIMLGLLGGLTYLYLFPEKFTTEYLQLECNADRYNDEAKMDYHSYKLYKFDKTNLIRSVSITDTYTFPNSNDYLEFKDNHKENEYFHINGSLEYDDNYLTIKLIYTEIPVVDNYEEIKSYVKSEGYECSEGKYYE